MFCVSSQPRDRTDVLFWCSLAAVEKRRERIWDAQRTGLRNRLRDQWRLSEDRAEACLAAWETEAASRGLEKLSDGFWAAAEDWLTEARHILPRG